MSVGYQRPGCMSHGSPFGRRRRSQVWVDGSKMKIHFAPRKPRPSCRLAVVRRVGEVAARHEDAPVGELGLAAAPDVGRKHLAVGVTRPPGSAPPPDPRSPGRTGRSGARVLWDPAEPQHLAGRQDDRVDRERRNAVQRTPLPHLRGLRRGEGAQVGAGEGGGAPAEAGHDSQLAARYAGSDSQRSRTASWRSAPATVSSAWYAWPAPPSKWARSAGSPPPVTVPRRAGAPASAAAAAAARARAPPGARPGDAKASHGATRPRLGRGAAPRRATTGPRAGRRCRRRPTRPGA